MVTINKDGHVIISLDDLSYDLNVSKDYSDFLLKVTSPSSDVNLNEDCFTIEEGLDDDKSAKARRYAEFLIDFVQRREKQQDEAGKLSTAKEREEKIRAFIDRLNKTEIQDLLIADYLGFYVISAQSAPPCSIVHRFGKEERSQSHPQLLPQERQGVIVRASPWREMRYHHPDRNESTFDSRLIRT